MSDVDLVAEAIYREHWGGEPRFKQDRFHTLYPDDQDEYRRMAQAAIDAIRMADVQRVIDRANHYYVGLAVGSRPLTS
jgi:hypothetical protein